MNVEIGTEASQFPEKEYINGIFLAVPYRVHAHVTRPSEERHPNRGYETHPKYDTPFTWSVAEP